MKITFSQHARSIFREDINPREYPIKTTFKRTLGSYMLHAFLSQH